MTYNIFHCVHLHIKLLNIVCYVYRSFLQISFTNNLQATSISLPLEHLFENIYSRFEAFNFATFYTAHCKEYRCVINTKLSCYCKNCNSMHEFTFNICFLFEWKFRVFSLRSIWSQNKRINLEKIWWNVTSVK